MKFRLKTSLACRIGYATFILPLAATAHGTVPTPVETVLYNFDIIEGGNSPHAPLTPGPNGVYYGTTDKAGTAGNGTVFALIPPPAGQSGWTEQVLYSFSGAPDGATPSSGLLVGADGALYGVTGGGGAHGGGAVFKLTPPAAGQTAWTETVLFSFNGGSDGQAPFGTLIADANGVLYGSTVAGGNASHSGVVFSLTPPSAGGTAWTEAVLYAFRGKTDGLSPSNGLLLDDTGALFGMTSAGGKNGAGTVFRLTPPATSGSEWSKTILHTFSGQSDGAFPNGALVRDGNGVLYGTTNASGASGWGTVFSLAPPPAGKTAWVAKVLYSFTGALDGGSPDYTPVLGANGVVYGTTNAGGTAGSGAVFALTPPPAGSTAWTEAALVSLTGPNGANPVGVTLDPSGALIGTAFDGGTLGNGGGAIFALTPPAAGGAKWTQSVLHQFAAIGPNAASPLGPLLMTKSGAVFGSANYGGAHGDGAVFELTPPASGKTGWHSTLLHSFDGTDGAAATGNLLQGKNGVLYGITAEGGPKGVSGLGTVYALTPPAAGQKAWTEQVLHAFTGVTTGDGAFPATGLIADASGALYGTASGGGAASSDDPTGNGIVYKLTPPATSAGNWTETILYTFMGPDGASPEGSLLFDKSGALYGTTYVGGTAGEGTVFKLTPPASAGGAWTESVLHSFNASVNNDGAIPGAEQLIADASGALYGTASQGGLNNDGAVFKLTPPTGTGTAWTETLIHSFTGADGTFPFVGLLANRNGALYGVTEQGGEFQFGTVFKLIPPSTGTTWTTKVVHSFNPAYGRDGEDAAGALVKDAKGNVYGTTAAGGLGGSGVLFEITP